MGGAACPPPPITTEEPPQERVGPGAYKCILWKDNDVTTLSLARKFHELHFAVACHFLGLGWLLRELRVHPAFPGGGARSLYRSPPRARLWQGNSAKSV